ncbi:hypothetical protein BBJ28_00021524 [Nothophytophthora sp. Chile5]|nr:hypothetical protein BBJ28_00021524 [Nothophytophthora sp. Chile5]
MHSAVLHLRGDVLTAQPTEDSAGNVLCWNGEVFGMADGDEQDERLLMQDSDTAYLSERLRCAGGRLDARSPKTLEIQGDPVVQVLRQIRGPFAMAWLHASTQRLYFAHDRFGRRSLLYHQQSSRDTGDLLLQLADQTHDSSTTMTSKLFSQAEMTRFVLSSVAIQGGSERLNGRNNDDTRSSVFQEVPASGVYVLNLRAQPSTPTEGASPLYRMEFHPYPPLLSASDHVLNRFSCELPRLEPSNVSSEDAVQLATSATALLTALSNAVGLRVRSIPSLPSPSSPTASKARVAVFFSGGLDSVVLAALAHFHLPDAEPVDLLTVCFDESSGFASPDRQAAELACTELCELFPTREWRLVRIDVSRLELQREQREVQALMSPCETHMDFNIGAAFWFLSRGQGTIPKPSQAGKSGETTTLKQLNAFLTPGHADLRALETDISMLNLFEAKDESVLCPVYRCGRKRKRGCVLDVCRSCCFKIQRTIDSLLSHQLGAQDQDADPRQVQGLRAKLLTMGVQSETHIDRLLELLKSTVSDDFSTLTCRVHRSKQQPMSSESCPPPPSPRSVESTVYQTQARVVFVGIGADEQLAGYGRHRTALVNGGEQALRTELREDLERIWKRNLGRDDRCIAAHGREARFPYLDEEVVATIASFPTSSLCDAQLPRGVGDKRALRLVAQTLGLRSCAGLAKRAIQFGSRIAKVSSSTSNRQTQGDAKFSGVE